MMIWLFNLIVQLCENGYEERPNNTVAVNEIVQ